MTRSTLVLALVFAAGCPENNEIPEFTEDIRIDFADQASDPDSESVRMCLTDEGVVYVLWLDNRVDIDSDKMDIWMNRSLNRGQDWLPAPVKVNQGDAEAEGPGNVFQPQVFCNNQGVYVVWEDDRDGELENHNIYFNKSTDQGETFLPEDILLEFDREGNTMSLEPRITGTGEDLFVTWFDSANGAYDIFVSSSSDGGESWRDSIRIDSDLPAGSAYSARPKIAISEDADNVWVVWEDSRDGNADIYFARSINGGVTFEDDVRLDGGDADGEFDSFEPQLCTDGVSNVYVFWHDSRNSETSRDIYFNFSLDSGDDFFSDARRLDSDNAGAANSLFPVCAVKDSTAHVVWQDNRNRGYDIFYRSVTDGIPDLEEARADLGNEPGASNALDTVIDLDIATNTVVLAWNDGRAEAEAGGTSGYTDIYYNFSENGLPFEPGVDYRVDSMFAGQSYKIDLNFQILGGEWYAAWSDGRLGTSDVYFQRFPIGEESNPLSLADVQ